MSTATPTTTTTSTDLTPAKHDYHIPIVPITATPALSKSPESMVPSIDWSKQTDGTALIQWDKWLAPYADVLRGRYSRVQDLLHLIDEREGGLEKFAQGYLRFGLNRGSSSSNNGQTGTWYREWAPGAANVSLIGEFNGWDRNRNPCTRDGFGVWSCFVPDHSDGSWGIAHQSRYKASVQMTSDGHWEDRVPAWATRVVQHGSPIFEGQFWCLGHPYQWAHPRPSAKPRALKIYEVHVGMSGAEPRISTYAEFTRDIIPYAKKMGYNAIQIMAVMEHAYYGSFGYQVTSFFAASSRFGTPEELKNLVDTAHGQGIHVLLDVVHSHASNNVADGLNHWDGTDHQYFHGGVRGRHAIWDSRLFNYGNWETMRFLLSNLSWWLEEYHFDGFRFDGVTSMLYVHHGIGDHEFTYDHVFKSGAVDADALSYLTLATKLIHMVHSGAVIIAEDVSGFPGLCRPLEEGGIGFDFRLQMACPDLWISTLKKSKDEDWDMEAIAYTLSNRRYKEPCVAYAESHDQALVGDKTIAFWLMDKEMYWFMSDLTPMTPIIDRGLALHKLIRIITFMLSGEGYLTFMGNEFAHPEWIDFPREGNGNSYHHARRQWGLVRDPLLRYKYMANFEQGMLALEEKYHFLDAAPAYVYIKHNEDKVIMFERGNLIACFNFNPAKSFEGYRIPIPDHLSDRSEFVPVFNSDLKEYAGHERIDPSSVHYLQDVSYNCGSKIIKKTIQVYLPSRTCVIFRRKDML